MFTYIIFVLYNIIYIYHFTNVFTRVIEHFPKVLLMVIVNVFHNLLKLFKKNCVCRAFSSFLCLVYLVPFMLTLHSCCERYLRSLDHVIKKSGKLKTSSNSLDALQSYCNLFCQYAFVLTSCCYRVRVVVNIPTSIFISFKK